MSKSCALNLQPADMNAMITDCPRCSLCAYGWPKGCRVADATTMILQLCIRDGMLVFGAEAGSCPSSICAPELRPSGIPPSRHSWPLRRPRPSPLAMPMPPDCRLAHLDASQTCRYNTSGVCVPPTCLPCHVGRKSCALAGSSRRRRRKNAAARICANCNSIV